MHNAKHMKHAISAWLCVLALNVASAGQVSTGARNSPSPKLELSLRTDRTSYSMTDKMHIEVQLTNIGNTDVYVWSWIFCWGQGPSLSIRALNNAGQWVQPASGFLLDCVPPPPKANDPTQFIKIEPGRFYGLAEDFPLKDLMDGPGQRTLIVKLGGTLSRDFITGLGYPDLPYWTSEDRPLTARVRLTVTH